jgi:hypothetical protein
MDAETKEILRYVCEMVRDQIQQSSEVNLTMTAVARAILDGDSTLKHRFENQWLSLAFLNPESGQKQVDERLQRLTEIIQRLKE